MPRVRRLDALVPDHDEARCRFAAAVADLSPAYGQALLDLALTGPCSGILVVAHPADPADDGVLVLVHCDRPDGSELIAVRVPDDVVRSSAIELSHLAADVLDGGLVRLAAARGWDAGAVRERLAQVRTRTFRTTEHSHRWNVTVQGRGATAPEQPHELTVVGGGPTNVVSPTYLGELDRLLGRMSDAAMVDWWTRSPVRLGQIGYWFDAKSPGIRVTVTSRVSATIHRPAVTTRRSDPVALARADVRALLERLAARLDLPSPPLLTEDVATAQR